MPKSGLIENRKSLISKLPPNPTELDILDCLVSAVIGIAGGNVITPRKKKQLTFVELVESIREAHNLLSVQATRAVNINLTLRNWVIGYYIEHYERSGVDRATYGDRLMDELSKSLKKQGLTRCDRRELYRYRQFYLTYPQIVETVSPQLRNTGQKLLTNLSFSHFVGGFRDRREFRLLMDFFAQHF